MKKGFLFLLSLFISHSALAESGMDLALKSIGAVDEDYRYTDHELVAAFFRLATNQYAQSLPMDTNNYTRILNAMFTPYYANISYSYTLPLTSDERRGVIAELSSKESLQEACIDGYIPNEFMLANNYTLVYSYSDDSYRPLADVKMNLSTCLDALTN